MVEHWNFYAKLRNNFSLNFARASYMDRLGGRLRFMSVNLRLSFTSRYDETIQFAVAIEARFMAALNAELFIIIVRLANDSASLR